MTLTSVNPYTNTIIKEFKEHSEAEIEKRLQRSKESFKKWKNTSFENREALMLKVAQLLLDGTNTLSKTISNEMGKPIKESRAEIEKCAWVCKYYAENAQTFLKQETKATDADLSYITYEPLGTILGII
ncbi:MAG: aldehyde dehydrogenase family protein [Bacteroidales bacterium]|nr:aldehyde dehydrogenase family protein [Bacteroidales bacterium]